jgi:hypothetical protein
MDDAVRGLMSSAGAARATRSADPEPVMQALRDAISPFDDPYTGAVTMHKHLPLVVDRRAV